MDDLAPELTLKPQTAFYIVLKARAFDAKVARPDGVDASNPADDQNVDVLLFQGDDATEQELVAAIRTLNDDERLDLIALIWIGRGDFTFDEWAEARGAARLINREQTPHYVLQIPLVSDYLEEALSELGYTLSDYLDTGVNQPAAPDLAPDSGL